MKKILFLLILLLLTPRADAQSVWINDLRSVFLNNNAVIYAINIRTFNAQDRNKNGIIDKGEESGNFINAIGRLDELSELGINTIHVLPITKTGKIKALGNAGSLYAMASFTELNPQFDDPSNKYNVYQEAKLFVSEAHRRGIRVIVDLPSCGAYDMYLSKPELFYKDAQGNPAIAADWTDVRVFKTRTDGKLNRELLSNYKAFIDTMLSLDVDGIRADVAAIKPYDFWKELIDYTRKKSPQFLFLAEASPLWDNPAKGISEYTSIEDLVKAGFDGHYGKYVNFENIKTADEFFKLVDTGKTKTNKKNSSSQTSVIGSFATHDIASPMLKGNVLYSEMLIWLNFTLPLNPYFTDGFLTGDTYAYPYSNQKALYSATDDDLYFTHKGKLDIFNFSRRPGGNSQKIYTEYFQALRFRNWAKPILQNGKFVRFKTTDENVIAYARVQNEDAVLVVANLNPKTEVRFDIKIPKLKESSFVVPVKILASPKIKNGKIQLKLMPYEVQVLLLNQVKVG